MIGLNAAGNGAIANGHHGVRIDGGANDNQVGAAPDEQALIASLLQNMQLFDQAIGFENVGLTTEVLVAAYRDLLLETIVANDQLTVISGNMLAGISIEGVNTQNNRIRAALVGTDKAGAEAVPNGTGIAFNAGAAYNTVDGATATLAGPSNAIAQAQSLPSAPPELTVGQFIFVDQFYPTLISGNEGSGISFNSWQDQITQYNTVNGSYIGTTFSGDAALANGTSGISIWNSAARNGIGVRVGSTPGTWNIGTANVISGNNIHGVSIGANGTDWNVVAGNLIGTNAAGTAPLANMGAGIVIQSGANGNQIGNDIYGNMPPSAANVIAGNHGAGVAVNSVPGDFETERFNTIAGNFIGVSRAGSAIPNSVGVRIDSSSGTFVGGFADLATNVIAGNLFSGVEITNSASSNNLVLHNLIGLYGIAVDEAPTLSGTTAVANGADGIFIHAGAHGNFIGTLGDIEAFSPPAGYVGNVIAANQANGVRILDAESVDNVLGRNFIGVDLSGTLERGNGGAGVRLSQASGTLIGDAANLDEANTIAFNNLGGVVIDGGQGNAVLHDYIFGNGPNPSFNIHLQNDGNHLQPAPSVSDIVVTPANGSNPGTVQVTFNVPSSVDTVGSLHVEFYLEDVDGGIDQIYLGSANNIDADTAYTLTFELPAGVVARPASYIISTATDEANNTSSRPPDCFSTDD